MPNYYVEGVKGVVITSREGAAFIRAKGQATKATNERASNSYCATHHEFYHWMEDCPQCIDATYNKEYVNEEQE